MNATKGLGTDTIPLAASGCQLSFKTMGRTIDVSAPGKVLTDSDDLRGASRR